MPIELKETLDTSRRLVRADDTGILVQARPRERRGKNPIPEVLTWLRSYADEYWKSRCPEEPLEETDAESTPKKSGSSHIQFVARDLNLDNTLVFISTNLVNTVDYLLFVFDTMAASMGERRTKYPFRAMPVLGLSVPKPREMEAMVVPLLEEIIGDQQPHRFSIVFNGSMDADHLTQKEAGTMLRNFIWGVNPNCVQCSKYQDFAFVLDIIKPFFCFGYLLDFIKLRRYRSQRLKLGYDLSGEGEDSEDEISDDPTLDEEEDRNRKMRIKRKRGAEKAGIAEENGENGDLKKADESLNENEEHAGSENEDDD